MTSLEHRDPMTCLPRELRAETAGMSWRQFTATYADGPHLVGLESWSAHRLGAAQFVLEATLTYRGARHTVTTTSSGPIAALTGILYDLGINIEILALHQQLVGGQVATFIHAESGGRRHWALGTAPDGVGSCLRAVVAAANLLAG